MAKYYENEFGEYGLELTYTADYDHDVTFTTESRDRFDGNVNPELALMALYLNWRAVIAARGYHKDSVIKLVRNRWYTTRQHSRTRHLEKEIVSEWTIDEYDEYVKLLMTRLQFTDVEEVSNVKQPVTFYVKSGE